ncbi:MULTISPECIES: polysaccharide biosynthesis tyrosine autokinase [Methylotenera]|uniref:polysaccharide biosynthesis tyrosine autokinase n=1 Tax=Methylotenera TaxID=359407 RepID=UPI0003783296|nr:MULTISPECIES: polysaccharide biosynthesis tyrosine autokinase [Methylotenera]
MNAELKNLHDHNNHDQSNLDQDPIESNVNPNGMKNLSVTEPLDSKKIGDALIAHAKLNANDVERILHLQKDKKILFGEAAKNLGLVTTADIEHVLAQQFNYPYIRETNSSISKLLTAAHTPFTTEVESLRSLRGQLMMRWFNQGHKTLAIASSNSDENAHLIAANLAITFSQLNKKTLLIDANLRQPNQHQLFGIDSKLGLTNILGNQQGSYELTRQKSLPNLAVLSAGTEVPNPQELLSLDAFSSLLTDLENIYDIILIDTTPLSLGSDMLSVVSKTKAAIIVARKDYTMAADLQLLNAQLSTTGAKVIGSILQEF